MKTPLLGARKLTPAEVTQHIGVTEATLANWRSKRIGWRFESGAECGTLRTTWKHICKRREEKQMPLRRRGPWWHYRITLDGQEHAGSTGLRATEENRKAAERFEKNQRRLILSGRATDRTKDFATAAGEFVVWCRDVEYRQKPNTAARIKTSFASLIAFFGTTSVPAIGAGEIERLQNIPDSGQWCPRCHAAP